MNEAPLIEARGISKSYGSARGFSGSHGVHALANVSLAVRSGETVAIVGESGSGKTTLGKALLGLVRPDVGEVVFLGQSLRRMTKNERRRYRRSVQAVFQNPLRSLNPVWSIASTLRDAMRYANGGDTEAVVAVEDLLDQVGLDSRFARRHPSEMSGGELQRAAIARALATGPSVLFLDEPTSALDVSVRGQIIDLLLALRARRALAMVWVTHELRIIRAISDRVAVMYQGEIVEQASTPELFGHPLHPYTRALLAGTLFEERDARGQSKEWFVMREEAGVSRAAGCLSSDRCRFAEARCRAEPQVLRLVSSGHWARCWRAESLDEFPRQQAPTG